MASSNARLQERLDALEDEVELLKTEIKQTLIDMREAMLQTSDVLSLPRNGGNTQESAVVDASPEIARPVEVQEHPVPSPAVASSSNLSVSYTGLDLSADQANKFIVNDVLENFVSKVGQHIEIMKLEEFGNALFIDSELQVAEKDEKKYSGQFVNSALSLSKDNSSAAIIGGGDGGVARECLSKGFDLVDWYELDPEVVKVCQKHLTKICGEIKANNNVKTYYGDAFESIKKVKDSKYDKIFVDLNDDQFCIDLAAKNMKSLKRILPKW